MSRYLWHTHEQAPAQANSDNGLTMAVLGCGNLGTAILSGIFDSLSQMESSKNTESKSDLPARLPTRFNACVKRAESAARLKSTLNNPTVTLKVFENDNLAGIKDAEIVLLGCKPYMIKPVLEAEGIKDALKGKLLLSILAGVPESQIEDILYPGQSHAEIVESGGATVVRVMPNTPAAVREAMTVIATQDPPLQPETSKLIDWIFTRIGKVVHLPSANMDASTALCGSGPAFVALMMDALADGGVAMGIPRKEAQIMAAQTMKGTAQLVLNGEHPAVLKDKVTTPGGCTIGGLMVLEEKGVRGAVSRAVREATVVASQLGAGVKGVNGTRW